MKIKLRNIAIVLGAGVAAAAGFVAIGFYNVAATAQHIGPVYRLVEYALFRSVRFHASDIKVPDLTDKQRIRNGIAHYRAHCLQCHGAPGVAPAPFSMGMTPAPANMVSAALEWKPAELYWITRHGIKMSGMPAWEYRLSEQEMWDIVAFIETMPTLSPIEYKALNTPSPADASAEALPRQAAARVERGTVDAGKQAVKQYLCATCHQIPGVVGAFRHVGPPLNGIAHRKYIAGILPNTPENMVGWLKNPQHFDPLSAMPDLGVTDQHARDMAAFLYTLEDLD